MIVDCAVYRRGHREEVARSMSDSLAEVRSAGDGFVWVGLHEPTAEEFDKMASDFKLHPLAVEDAVKAHQRPKVEEYADSIFVVLKTVRYDEPAQQVELGDIMIFMGDAFIVTVRHGEGSALKDVRHRLELEREALDCGPSAVLYAVCDRVVDDYTDITYLVEDDIEEVEQRVFAPGRSNDAERIYNLKREVIEFRKAVRPLVDPMAKLATGVVPLVHDKMRPFFRDVADHAIRVAEAVDSFDDLLSSVLAAHLAQVGVQQNSDMRRISAWVAILAVPTMIAGIYGMNFTHMPELRWRLGYPMALGAMALACYGLYRAFKRSGWL